MSPAASAAALRPFFTSRVGFAQYEDHGEPDPRQARTSESVRADLRSRFKNSYGVVRTPPRPYLSVPRTSDEPVGYDPGAARRELDLIEELRVAQTEIQQLRNALRASAHALKHAASLLPPEVGHDVEEQRLIIDDLNHQLAVRDLDIHTWSKRAVDAETYASRNRIVVRTALSRWADHRGFLYLHDAFSAWRPLQQERRQQKKFKEALASARNVDATRMSSIVLAIFGTQVAVELRGMLLAWLACAQQAKREARARQLVEERKQRVISHFGAGNKRMLQEVCLNGWIRFRDFSRSEKREVALQKEHSEASKAMKRDLVFSTTLALAGKGDPAVQSYLLAVCIRCWQEAVLDTKSRKKLEEENERVQAANQRYEAHLQRNFVLLTNQGTRQQLSVLFETWREFLAEGKQERLVETLRKKGVLVKAWHVVAINNKYTRDVEKERKRVQEMEEKHRGLLEVNQQRRAVVMNFAAGDKTQDTLLTHVAWSAWRETLMESKRNADLKAQKEEMEKNWACEREQAIIGERMRAATIAFGMSGKAQELSEKLVLTSTFSAWFSSLQETRRQKELSAAERLFEEEKKRSLEEDKLAAQEAQEASSRHKDSERKRKLVFLMSLEGQKTRENEQMLLRTLLVAWHRSLLDEKEKALEMQTALLASQNKELLDAIEALTKIPARKDEAPPPALPRPKKSFMARVCFCRGGKKEKKSGTRVAPAPSGAAAESASPAAPLAAEGVAAAADPAAGGSAAASDAPHPPPASASAKALTKIPARKDEEPPPALPRPKKSFMARVCFCRGGKKEKKSGTRVAPAPSGAAAESASPAAPLAAEGVAAAADPAAGGSAATSDAPHPPPASASAKVHRGRQSWLCCIGQKKRKPQTSRSSGSTAGTASVLRPLSAPATTSQSGAGTASMGAVLRPLSGPTTASPSVGATADTASMLHPLSAPATTSQSGAGTASMGTVLRPLSGPTTTSHSGGATADTASVLHPLSAPTTTSLSGAGTMGTPAVLRPLTRPTTASPSGGGNPGTNAAVRQLSRCVRCGPNCACRCSSFELPTHTQAAALLGSTSLGEPSAGST